MDKIELYFSKNDDEFIELFPKMVGCERCKPLHKTPRSLYNYNLLHYVLGGKGTFKIDGNSYSVKKGEIFIIPKNTLCEYVADKNEPWEYVWIALTGKLADKLYQITPVIPFNDDAFENMRKSIKTGIKSVEKYISYAYSIYYSLFGESNYKQTVFDEIKNYLDAKFNEDISVEGIANSYKFDSRYLSRTFKKHFGKSIKEYLIDVRIKNAIEYLSRGISVNECAFLCGYKDEFNFSKSFKKNTGYPPSKVKTLKINK